MIKKIILVSILLIAVFTTCNSKQSSENKSDPIKKLKESANKESGVSKKDVFVCDILTENFLTNIFPDAINFKQQAKEKPYPSCSYRLEYKGENYKVGFTLVKKYASEKNLDKAISYFSVKEPLQYIGKKAYYIPQLGQVSLFNNNYLAHVYVTINEKGNKDLAIQITKELIEKIDN